MDKPLIIGGLFILPLTSAFLVWGRTGIADRLIEVSYWLLVLGILFFVKKIRKL